jgi:RNA polymerase sigma factor (sigma-70 family)
MPEAIDNERFRKLLLAYPAKAVELLYRLQYRHLKTIAWSLTHDKSASEDIVQETFIHVWENHKRLGQADNRSIEHYLTRVVKNKAITYYKRTRVNNENVVLNGHAITDVEGSVENNIIRDELIGEVRRTISRFPRREKECLMMKIDSEMTTQQIAVCLNVSLKAVERSITSAYKRLRKFFKSRMEIESRS